MTSENSAAENAPPLPGTAVRTAARSPDHKELAGDVSEHSALSHGARTGLPFLLHNFNQAHAIRASLVNKQVAGPGHSKVPDDSDSGGNGPALKSFRLRVEPHKRIRSHPRLVVPDDIVHDSKSIR